jgi:hypothetical protein
MNASAIFQEGHWYIWHIYLITAFGCPIFQSLGRKQIYKVPKPGEGPKFPHNLRPFSLLPTTGKIFANIILKIIQSHIEKGHA